MEQRSFGKTRDGREAALYILKNHRGMVMEVSDYGATLVALRVPGRDGRPVDVVLGYDSAAGYENAKGLFFGATVGRNANRIGGAAFTLNGKNYTLDKNDGGNNLHSGLDFYHNRYWAVTAAEEDHVTFSLHSPDGDQGYPGALELEVTYTLTKDNGVRIDYRAVPQCDTIVNPTNHSYFNLNGHASGSIAGHSLWVDADAYTRADAASIPTGEITPVAGTPMDFRAKKPIGRDVDADYEALRFGKGYDHNWCLNNGGHFAKVAELTGDVSGITMEVYTDLPGVQFYSGNFLTEEPGKEGAVYRHRQGLCLETQHYPDAVNHANFPSPVCPARTVFHAATEYRFI